MNNIQTLFDTFNAKHKAESEVAATFVRPPGIVDQLLSHNHVVLTGPRGSGKTTLLKMLTASALANWKGPDAEEVKRKVDFVSIFVPADRSWHGQLKGLNSEIGERETAELLGLSTFTTHICKAIIGAFMDWQSDPVRDDITMSKILPELSYDQEQEIVDRLAASWFLAPRAKTFFELRSALAERLAGIGLLKNKLKYFPRCLDETQPDYLFIDYREAIKLAHTLHNTASNRPLRRWLIMFDELEVAPSSIQDLLIRDMRGAFEQGFICYRLALAPYNRNFIGSSEGAEVLVQNDFHHINLSFPRKERGLEFSKQLCISLMRQSGINQELDHVFGKSMLNFDDPDSHPLEDTNSGSKYGENSNLGKVFSSLATKDASFAQYLLRRGLHLDDIEDLSELKRASTLRKVRNIVIIRDYFSKPSKSGLHAERLTARSRKTYRLYTGIPSLLALAEGNPRSLINLISPLMREFIARGGVHKVSETAQAEEIEKAIRIVRSLLRSIPVESHKPATGGAVLKILDDIGSGFYQGIVATKFSEQPPLSFRIDSGHSPAILSALGKALNMGGIVHVPDQGSEEIISSLVGKRFRLSYLLAAYYKLPLSLDREVSLSHLLSHKNSTQPNLLDLPDVD